VWLSLVSSALTCFSLASNLKRGTELDQQVSCGSKELQGLRDVFFTSAKLPYLLLKPIIVKSLLKINKPEKEADRSQHALSNMVPGHALLVDFVVFPTQLSCSF
jgi:hypothetical protein